MTYVQGDVVWHNFPKTLDDENSDDDTPRPALVLHVDRRNLIVCMFSTRGDRYEPHIEVKPGDFTYKGLRQTTFLRPARITTDDVEYTERLAGKLHPDKVKECIDCICEVIRAGRPPQ